MKGNFYFIKDLDINSLNPETIARNQIDKNYVLDQKNKPNQNWWYYKNELFKKAVNAEKNFWIDWEKCAKLLREALENYISMFELEHGIYVNATGDKGRLGRRIEFLIINNKTDASLNSKVNVQTQPKNSQQTISEENVELADAIRRIGNYAVHGENITDAVIIPYTHVNLYLLLKRFFEEIYRRYDNSNTPRPFNFNIVPIGGHEITRYYQQLAPLGLRKYGAILRLPESNVRQHELVYLYPHKAFTDAERELLVARLEKITEIATDKIVNKVSPWVATNRPADGASGNIFLVYAFKNEPMKLNNALFADPALKRFGKRRLCHALASYLCEMAKGFPSVHHRFLTDEAILVDKDEKGVPIPRIVDFVFAKVEGEKTLKRYLSENKGKYFPPDDVQSGEPNWEKYDVFSLGVLFKDILDDMRNVGEEVELTDELKAKYAAEFGAKWWDALERMCGKDIKNTAENRRKIEARPTLEEVVGVLSKEPQMSAALQAIATQSGKSGLDTEDEEEETEKEIAGAMTEEPPVTREILLALKGNVKAAMEARERLVGLSQPQPGFFDKLPGFRKAFDERYEKWLKWAAEEKRLAKEEYDRFRNIVDGITLKPAARTQEENNDSRRETASGKRRPAAKGE
ncbi:MAG: DUF4145 domain-containing protein [Synergistaceae bacterium]|nr:DUF4145 domain-containing protein [Synergistaceae bacterium]